MTNATCICGRTLCSSQSVSRGPVRAAHGARDKRAFNDVDRGGWLRRRTGTEPLPHGPSRQALNAAMGRLIDTGQRVGAGPKRTDFLQIPLPCRYSRRGRPLSSQSVHQPRILEWLPVAKRTAGGPLVGKLGDELRPQPSLKSTRPDTLHRDREIVGPYRNRPERSRPE